VLRRERERVRFVFREITPLPQSFEQVEAELASENFLYDLAVAAPVRAARTLTERRTSSSIVRVVRILVTLHS